MTDTHVLRVEGVTLAYGERTVVESLDLLVPPGQITAIIGANACGKSTLLRAMSRLLAPRHGRVVLDGKDLHRLPTREVARTLGLLPQSPIAPEGITVSDLVARGRHPYRRLLARWTAEDDAAVARALELTGTVDLADRPVEELSGGQRQRVWIAMALAQQTDILLLDEPTTFLDLNHQVEVLDLLTDLNRERGTTIVMVLHDLNLAARYADHLVAVKAGQVYAAGAPEAVLDATLVREVFSMDSQVVPDPVTGRPLVLPISRHHCSVDRREPVTLGV
ncbi:MAG: ABC transporter ATP-binding protein [Micromonosporaceae bacterium]|nr:ABC transporter ATP-binding protein [Micromonosporaceae bacterium]